MLLRYDPWHPDTADAVVGWRTAAVHGLLMAFVFVGLSALVLPMAFAALTEVITYLFP